MWQEQSFRFALGDIQVKKKKHEIDQREYSIPSPSTIIDESNHYNK
jgi:hypothetical protein